VYSPEEAKNFIKPTDIIVNTVLDIQDTIPIIDSLFPDNQSIALGELLNDQNVDINKTEVSDEFIEYTLKAVEMCHKSFANKERDFIHSLDVVISEKCSLNCKDCSNLMQYYTAPENLNYDGIISDFEKLTAKIKHVYEIRLIGGEPFMNKAIYSIIDYFDNKIGGLYKCYDTAEAGTNEEVLDA
jgi:hypothetical protein